MKLKPLNYFITLCTIFGVNSCIADDYICNFQNEVNSRNKSNILISVKNNYIEEDDYNKYLGYDDLHYVPFSSIKSPTNYNARINSNGGIITLPEDMFDDDIDILSVNRFKRINYPGEFVFIRVVVAEVEEYISEYYSIYLHNTLNDEFYKLGSKNYQIYYLDFKFPPQNDTDYFAKISLIDKGNTVDVYSFIDQNDNKKCEFETFKVIEPSDNSVNQ